MLGPGRATYRGQYAEVEDAVNEPKGIQRHIPIIVGGNGREKTASLAVKHADELNLVYVRPVEVRELITAVRERCERAGRDPDTLRISLYTADDDFKEGGQARIDLLAEYRQLPLSRIVLHPLRWEPTVEALERFAGECVAAGFILDA
jgi:alkanesulfonate monooxygenase SsuD/methylene tetrahydromethanopterin reductase-like flavin-dependent oxidoreductase (luciferase family)